MRILFELARYHAPSTIFLDELDAIMSTVCEMMMMMMMLMMMLTTSYSVGAGKVVKATTREVAA